MRVKIYALILGAYNVKEDKRHFYVNLTKQATSQMDGSKLFMDTEEFKRILNIKVVDGEIRFIVRTKKIDQLISILKASVDARMEEVA